MPSTNRQPALSPDAFQAFLSWLAPHDEESGEAYEKARRRLILFFAARQCREPETLADKTIDIAIRKIFEISPVSEPMAYLFGIAKNIHREYLREIEREKEAHSSPFSAPAADSEAESDRLHEHLERCLQKLPSEDRGLVLTYYKHSGKAKIEQRRVLANQFNLTLNALRNRIFRINRRLERCIADGVNQSPT